MIARLEVTRGPLTEYPLAEKVRGGWQNGVTFYADAEVTKVTPLRIVPADTEDAMIAYLDRLPSHITHIPVGHVRALMPQNKKAEEADGRQ